MVSYTRMNIWHPVQLKQLKPWELLWCYQLDSTANPDHLPKDWAKLAPKHPSRFWYFQLPRLLIIHWDLCPQFLGQNGLLLVGVEVQWGLYQIQAQNWWSRRYKCNNIAWSVGLLRDHTDPCVICFLNSEVFWLL